MTSQIRVISANMDGLFIDYPLGNDGKLSVFPLLSEAEWYQIGDAKCALHVSAGLSSPAMNDLISDPAFLGWIEHSLAQRENVLAVSNQGTVLHYREGGVDLIVKAAMGSGPVRALRDRTLLREYHAYQRLGGLHGVPRCHGMAGGRYLVLDFIRGTPYREATWSDRDGWFARLLAIVRSFHQRGVSHGDLKSKSNILVTEDEKPCVIDFGTAFIRKPGFHPLNNRLFEHGRRMDINAWVKHKYHGRYEDIEGADLELLDYSRIEYCVRKLSGRPTDVIPRRNTGRPPKP
jgi:serine/threonine protein kinase